ncbi:MAG: RecX family transcriptional regulator [Dehalococcoidia bacterium]|nr:RecX family transcriptional regulator [Dehalococcoidia bacterium]
MCEEVARNLRKGQTLLSHEIPELTGADTFQQCYQAALRFLSYRTRSASEVKNRLLRKNFNPEIVSQTIQQLKDRNLLNDDDFARLWKENRDVFSPRSRRMIQAELKFKGVSPEVALKTTESVDDLDAARRAAAKKIKVLTVLDKEVFKKKLSSFLVRRGFGWGTIKKVVEETLTGISPDS